MSARPTTARSIVTLLALLALFACGSRTELFDDDSSATATGPGFGIADGGGGTSDGGVARRDSGLPPPNPPPPPGDVFGHSSQTLFRIDLAGKQVQTVADFDGCSGVLDIAVDGAGRIFASTGSALYTIDPATAACMPVARGSYPNSLGFLPAGVLFPNREALVGYSSSDGEYFEIDPDTGAVTIMGELGRGFRSSGDVVWANGASFVSAIGPECDVPDCLVEVDPQTGAVLKNWGYLGHASVYGLAAAAGRMYGFAEAGTVFEIAFAGDRVETTVLLRSTGASFYGAGTQP